MPVFTRPKVEQWVAISLAVAIVMFTLGSSSVVELAEVGRPGRWAVLLVLVAFEVAAGIVSFRMAPVRVDVRLLGALAALVALMGVSAAWSVDPRVSLARAASVALIIGGASALSFAAVGRPRVLKSLATAMLAAITVVALAGAAVLAVRPEASFQELPVFRYRGLGENPNTVSLLAALGLPLAAWYYADSRATGRRRAAVAAGAVLYATIALSQSRGALIAGCVAVMTFVFIVAANARVRALAAAVVVAAAAVAVALVPVVTTSVAYAASAQPQEALNPGRLEDEVGRPNEIVRGRGTRDLLSSSGRLSAWAGAVDQSLDRPLLGYGFGTEDRVFVDRFYSFQGSRPENSVLGMLLQLGAIGAALLVLVISLIVGCLRTAVRGAGGGERRFTAAMSGVVVGGITLMLVQSYVYSAGNIATLPFWTCALLLASAAAGRRIQQRRTAAAPVASYAVPKEVAHAGR